MIQQYMFYHRFLSNDLPTYFTMIPYDRRHGYNTRLQSDQCLPRIQHEFMKKCIRYNLPSLINHTPINIKGKLTTHSLNGFAKYLKKIIHLNDYQFNCNNAVN